MMDANKDALHRRSKAQATTNKDIRMRMVVQSATDTQHPKTSVKKQLAIAGICVSEEIEVSSAAYLSCNSKLGDK